LNLLGHANGNLLLLDLHSSFESQNVYVPDPEQQQFYPSFTKYPYGWSSLTLQVLASQDFTFSPPVMATEHHGSLKPKP